jgi:putative FmdB family regulatory protein
MEKIQKFSDDPLVTCPECGEDRLRKLVSAAAFKLKGTGWYETDFKDKPKNKDKSPGSNNSTDSKKDSGKKSDSAKSDSKTTSKPD